MQAIRWVIFDYGGVLSLDQPAEDRAALAAAAAAAGGATGDGAAFWSAYWRLRPPYDASELDAAGYWAAVLGRDPAPAQLDRLAALDVASWLHPRPEVLAIVDALAGRGSGLALLSNAPTGLADALDEQPWMQRVPHRFYSCRHRVNKPDPEAYRRVLAALDATPAEVAFVDDRPGNVAAAAAVGLRAVQFRSAAALAADLDLPADRAGRPAERGDAR